jgi:16S rRNA processing protein RimM
MIRREELVKIGKFHRPHGIGGELSFSFTDDSFDGAENPFLVCELDGLFVPFRLEEYRFTSGSAALVQLRTVDSGDKARRLAGREVYFPKDQLREAEAAGEAQTGERWVGFAVIDERLGELGVVTAVDDSTLNVLFIVERDGEELLVPAAEGIVVRVDPAGRKIYVALPDGFPLP